MPNLQEVRIPVASSSQIVDSRVRITDTGTKTELNVLFRCLPMAIACAIMGVGGVLLVNASSKGLHMLGWIGVVNATK